MYKELRKSKDYIADSFYPPVTLRSGALIEMLQEDKRWQLDYET